MKNDYFLHWYFGVTEVMLKDVEIRQLKEVLVQQVN